MAVEDDATSRSPVDSVSFGILPDVIPGGDHVVGLDVEHVEEKVVDLVAVRRTKKNPQNWVFKKYGSQLVSLISSS